MKNKCDKVYKVPSAKFGTYNSQKMAAVLILWTWRMWMMRANSAALKENMSCMDVIPILQFSHLYPILK